MTNPGLYIVATPIGNMNDLTPRAAQVLREVAWVAAEDTRHSAALLSRCGSRALKLAAHEHNEEAAAVQVIDRLQQGDSVALVSDAGTPAISDPGARLVARVREAGFPVWTVPGPCAAIAALSISGFAGNRFLFVGFLSNKTGLRQRELCELRSSHEVLIFYEAPHRIEATLSAMKAVFGEERRILIARELTKRFEESDICRLGAAEDWLQANSMRGKGEFVLVLEAMPPQPVTGLTSQSERLLSVLLAEGLPVKQAARIAAAVSQDGKNAIYQRALALRDQSADNGASASE